MLLRIIVGTFVSAGITYLTLSKKALTIGAAIESCVMMLIAAAFGGYAALFALVFSFLLVSVAGKATALRREVITAGMYKKHGTRDAVQVLVNGFFAAFAAVLHYITNNEAFILLYFVAVSESLTDSLASDVGVLSSRPPIDICRFKRMEKGMSGGISLLGTTAGFAGSVIMALAFMLFFGWNAESLLVAVACPMVGMIVDSVLGSLMQVKFICSVCDKKTERTEHCGAKTIYVSGIKWLDNDMVNLIGNAVSVLVAGCMLFAFNRF